MEREFVSHTRALKLKYLGFNGRCLTYYEDGIAKIYGLAISGWDFNTSFLNCLSRPTYAQAFRWFREEHNLFGKIEVLNFGADEYCFEIYDLFEEKTTYDNFQGAAASYTGTFNTYEEAELACLDKLIEIVNLLK
jgi:hypothetical protein